MRCNRNLASLLPLVLCTAFSACGPSRYYFRPAEKLRAESLDGFPAAEYEVSVGAERWGEVRIWSEGAELRSHGGPERTVVIVGFEIENNSEAPLQLDLTETRLRVIRAGESEVVDCQADPLPAEVRAGPHTVHGTRLEFWLPENVRPVDLKAFRVRWVVRGPGQQRYQQHTAFLRAQPVYARYYGYHPWRFGYGFWFGPDCW